MFNQPQTYMGNPLLKGPRVSHSWTEDEVNEYAKCREDSSYFFKKYMKIVHVDKGLISFDPYPYQEDLLNLYENNRYVIVKAPRQSGKSVATIAFILHYILYNEEKVVAILAHKAKTSRELLSRIKKAYEHLPKFLQQGIIKWNESSIELENGCKIIADATSGSAARGESIALLYLDEFAFVPTNIADDFFKSVYPTVSSGTTTKVFISSTPDGFNHYYRMWNEAEKGLNQYIPFEVLWNDVPGRDEEYKKTTIADLGEEAWNQEYEAQFLGSSNTLIAAKTLKAMSSSLPLLDTGEKQIYEFAMPGHTYNICVDTSRGLGEDYSAFNVIDVTEFPYKQVAKYKSNVVSSLFFPHIVYEMATQYNNASVLVELNDLGQQVADILYYDIEYENVIMVSSRGPKGQIVSAGFSSNMALGIKTSITTKKIGCATLKTLLEDNKILIRDEDTILELRNFIRVNQSYEAESGEHDDLVMCLVLFAWLSNQRFFKEQVGIDVREEMYENQIKAIENALLPILASNRSFMEDRTYEADDDFDKWF